MSEHNHPQCAECARLASEWLTIDQMRDKVARSVADVDSVAAIIIEEDWKPESWQHHVDPYLLAQRIVATYRPALPDRNDIAAAVGHGWNMGSGYFDEHTTEEMVDAVLGVLHGE